MSGAHLCIRQVLVHGCYDTANKLNHASLMRVVPIAGVFLGFEGKKIGDDISWAVIAIVCALTLASVALLYATAFVDPGFVPRDPEDEAGEEG